MNKSFFRNLLIFFGLLFVYSYIGGWASHLWRLLFVYNRIFDGILGIVADHALNIFPPLIFAVVVGFGSAVFLDGRMTLRWTISLGAVIGILYVTSMHWAPASSRVDHLWRDCEATVLLCAVMAGYAIAKRRASKGRIAEKTGEGS